MTNSFERWLDVLRDQVIKGEYGHSEGEYIVCPDAWRYLFDRGLTPAQAFRRTINSRSQDHDRPQGVKELASTGVQAFLEARTHETLH